MATGFEPTTGRRFVRFALRTTAACITVSPAMLFAAYTMLTLVHGATPGAGSASCRPRPELAQRITDAASGV